MKKKRILFLFVTLFASTLLYSQVVGVKTNLVMDAMKIINLGAEVGLSKKLTLDLYANYNPWKYKDQKMMKMLAIQPELRYWFCDKFNGHFVGFHVHGGVYQAAAIECKTCGEKVSEGHKNYLGPTKAAISLIYLF